MKPVTIKHIQAREILASGSYPTIETTVTLKGGAVGVASVPYGASAGSHEASILVDGDKIRYGGRGCRKAIRHVEKKIFPAVRGQQIKSQRMLDNILLDLDPTARKTKLGGNAVLSVSLAFARAVAVASGKPLHHYIARQYARRKKKTVIKKSRVLPVRSYKLPRPMMVVIEGGAHADNSTDFQEYVVCPLRNIAYHQSVRIGIEVYHEVRTLLKKRGYNVNVGTEGAFAPAGITSNEEPLKVITQAIKKAGYTPGLDVGIGIDAAASEFFHKGSQKPYKLSAEGKSYTASQMIAYYKRLIKKYPIISIEDGLDEDDWDNWTALYEGLQQSVLVVGDDLTVTQKKFLERAIEMDIINSILVKPNQVGTLSETLDTIALAQRHGLDVIVSHRGGGDTNDTFIMDLAAAVDATFTKVGPSRGERVEKYNRMMAIEQERR